MLKRLRNGFTLIEILIVMLIIALASSIIVLRMGNWHLSSKRSENVANEMVALIKLAKKQAIFASNVIGLRITAHDFSFLRLDTESGMTWQPMERRDIFWSARPIPDTLQVSLTMQEKKYESNLGKNSITPQIIILPSGELTPFTLSIHQTGSTITYVITGTYAGNITLQKME